MGYFNPNETVQKIKKETGISNEAPASVREAQPVAKAKTKKKAFVAPRKPIHIRQADYPAWLARRKAAHDSQ